MVIRGMRPCHQLLCRWRDSNPQALWHTALNRTCLPVSPHRRQVSADKYYYM